MYCGNLAIDDSVFANELTVSNYFLAKSDRSRHGSGVLLYIRDDLSYNVTLTGPDHENLELLGITLHNGNSDRFIVHLPPLVLYSNSCLFSFLQNLSPSLYSNFVLKCKSARY